MNLSLQKWLAAAQQYVQGCFEHHGADMTLDRTEVSIVALIMVMAEIRDEIKALRRQMEKK
jgi:hypothetical protein